MHHGMLVFDQGLGDSDAVFQLVLEMVHLDLKTEVVLRILRHVLNEVLRCTQVLLEIKRRFFIVLKETNEK